MTSHPPSSRRIEHADSRPFGTSFLPESGVGVDLTPAGYVEEEYLLSGRAAIWGASAVPGDPTTLRSGIPYTTRLVVRRPADAGRASGVVHLEPLHPHRDGGLTWRGAAPHILRSGDAWVGVTVYAHLASLLRERIDPERYAELDLPAAGLEWDIFADAAQAIRGGQVPGLAVERIQLSGWSATGSFVRVFVREGFAARRPGLVDGAVVFISSGGAGDAGYPPLSPDTASIALDDPRRTIRDAGIPMFEVLSETESETHEHQTRDDSDADGDRYRLYQVAGTAHEELWLRRVLTNNEMLEAVGIPARDGADVVEEFSDGRLDLVAQAALQRMSAWVADGTPPPSFPRFGFDGEADGENRPLARDPDGNVLGGVRTPWVEAPLAAYAPHGTPVSADPGFEQLFGAKLTGTMTRFPAERVRERFPDEDAYRAAFSAATGRLEVEGLLLAPGAEELRGSITERWRAAT